jgi:hypothetical protein
MDNLSRLIETTPARNDCNQESDYGHRCCPLHILHDTFRDAVPFVRG